MSKRKRRGPAAPAPPPAPEQPIGELAAQLAKIRATAEEDLRNIKSLLLISTLLGGMLGFIFFVVGLGVAIDMLLAPNYKLPEWLTATAAFIATIAGLIKGAQWGDAWPRGITERAYARTWKLLSGQRLPLLVALDDLPAALATLTEAEEWRRLALLDRGLSIQAQLKQAADFFPCLEAIVEQRPPLVQRWRFIVCAFSRWIDDATAFISRWFCCSCLIPWGAFLITLPALPLLLIPITMTLRRRAALLALCSYFGESGGEKLQMKWDEK